MEKFKTCRKVPQLLVVLAIDTTKIILFDIYC